jgi:hypothetical protein
VSYGSGQWDTPIEPKAPFYSRFEVLALILLPHSTNNALSDRFEAQAARLRAADPEQVGNLANGMAVPEQLGRLLENRRLQVPRHPPDLLDSLTKGSTVASNGKAPSPASVRAFSTWTSNRAPCSSEPQPRASGG